MPKLAAEIMQNDDFDADDDADAGCVIFLVSDSLLPHIYIPWLVVQCTH